MGDWEREKREAQKANQSRVTDIVTEGSIGPQSIWDSEQLRKRSHNVLKRQKKGLFNNGFHPLIGQRLPHKWSTPLHFQFYACMRMLNRSHVAITAESERRVKPRQSVVKTVTTATAGVTMHVKRM